MQSTPGARGEGNMIDRGLTVYDSADPAPQHAAAESTSMLLSKADLARELRVSSKTIDRMDQQGKLPRPIRIGSRAKRWPRETIVAWIATDAPNRRDWERLHG
jgi:predicted DNA-binding transcriptional regulator AlpA